MQIQWKAIYDDGTGLLQYNGDGTENKYTDIDRGRLIRFVLFEPIAVDKKFHSILGHSIKLVIALNGNKKLIYRRRVAMNITTNTREEVFLAGWQENTDGRNTQMLCFLFEDGHIEVVDRFNKNHPWFYGVNFIKEEKI